MVVAMIGLGFWQLDRLEARKADNDQIRAASDAPVRPIEDVLDDSREIFNMMMARENASQRREWMETYGNLVEADIS